MWTIVRVADTLYELRDPDGDAVEEYQQTKMQHPNDWLSDAVDNGAAGWDISSGNWEFIDARDV